MHAACHMQQSRAYSTQKPARGHNFTLGKPEAKGMFPAIAGNDVEPCAWLPCRSGALLVMRKEEARRIPSSTDTDLPGMLQKKKMGSAGSNLETQREREGGEKKKTLQKEKRTHRGCRGLFSESSAIVSRFSISSAIARVSAKLREIEREEGKEPATRKKLRGVE